MAKFKPDDKVIILDYNGKPLMPQVVARIEEVYENGRYRLDLPDGAACFEYENHFQKIDEVTYEKYLHAVRQREQELPLDLKMDIRKFVAKRPRLRRDIYRYYELDKKYVSIIHAYAGRIAMYGHDNIPEHFLWEFEDAKQGIVQTRAFFHDIDESIKEVEVPENANAPVIM